MKHIKYTLLQIFIVLLICCMVVGCSQKQQITNPYSSNQTLTALSSGTVAANESFLMLWDDHVKNVFIYDAVKQKMWSSFPYEAYQSGDAEGMGKVMMESPITIDYIESESNDVKTLGAAVGAIEDGKVGCSKIKNGLRVTYCFEQIKISVSVDYLLRKDGFALRIPIQEIKESENKLYKVTLAPFMASVKNNAENSYLFVPSGCGALMFTDEGKRSPRSFGAEVYGEDLAKQKYLQPTVGQNIKLPVFGVKDGNSALLGIIENGAESAEITAQSGNADMIYSSVAPSFQVRGMDKVKISYVGKNQIVSRKFSDCLLNAEEFCVGYYPLYEDKANFIAMAQTYRRYLTEQKGLKKLPDRPAPAVNILGGGLAKKFFAGIPYDSVFVTTTYEQAQKMVEELGEKIGTAPFVNLSGFGASGLDYDQAGNGIQFYGKFGGSAGWEQLLRYCDTNKIPLAYTVNLTEMRKSRLGFTRSFDAATTASGVAAKQNFYSLSIKEKDTELYDYVLLSRDKLLRSAERMISDLKKHRISYVNIGSLSEKAYSDYSNPSYYSKAGFEEQTALVIDGIHQYGHKAVTNNANAFAAVRSDYLLNAPGDSYSAFAFDRTIPFYQIVFKGYLPMTGASINTADEPSQEFLFSVMTGSNLYYTLIDTYHPELSKSPHDEFAQSVYTDHAERIANEWKQAKALLQRVEGQTIENFEQLQQDVYRTTFSNKTVVIVNMSRKPVQIEGITLQKESFHVVGEGNTP